MNKCCECKKTVWPWQGSSTAGNVIHAVCHQIILTKAAKDPKMKEMMRTEMRAFERHVGGKSNVQIP